MWIQRDIAPQIEANTDAIQVVRGPRQCGKSSLLLRLDPSFQEASLDDAGLRDLAQRDPELFLRQFGDAPIFIDEAQYAPQLFPSLKRRADLHKRRGEPRRTIIRLTGSNQIVMDRAIKESLAGRASYFDLNTLTVAELLARASMPVQHIVYAGGWPEVHANGVQNPKRFLDDYINTYIEKDVVLAAGIQKSREFLTFVRMLAGRVGTSLDLSGLAADCGVDAKTAKDWVSVLERMHIVALVPPYASNLTTRLVKTPKVYFLDTGLACRLQGWTSAEPIATSPQQGALFENLVLAELLKTKRNFGLDGAIYHWRSRAGEEVDFLVELQGRRAQGQRWLFVEAKVSAQTPPDLSRYPEVKKVFGREIPRAIVCHQEGSRVLADQVPIAFLRDTLLEAEREH